MRNHYEQAKRLARLALNLRQKLRLIRQILNEYSSNLKKYGDYLSKMEEKIKSLTKIIQEQDKKIKELEAAVREQERQERSTGNNQSMKSSISDPTYARLYQEKLDLESLRKIIRNQSRLKQIDDRLKEIRQQLE